MKSEPPFCGQLGKTECLIYGALLCVAGTPTLVVSGHARLDDESTNELLTELLTLLQGEIWSNVVPSQVCVSSPSQRLPTVKINQLRFFSKIVDDGQVATFLLSNRPEGDMITDVAAVLLDNQAREVLKLRGLSTTDDLTGLKNRRYMRNKLSEMIAVSGRYSHIFSVALVDLDQFKKVNKLHGYAAGDQVLVSFASLLKSLLRSADSIVRYGGDEFVLLMPATDCDGCAVAVARLQSELGATTHEIDGIQLAKLSFSAGISEFKPSLANHTSDALLEKADAKLRAAKLQGPGSIAF